MPLTRSQSGNRPLTRSSKKNFIDPKEDPEETEKAFKELKKICQNYKNPTVSVNLEDDSAVSITTDTEDPEWTDADDEDLDAAEELFKLEQICKAVLPPEKYDEFIKIKEAIETSEPNIISLLDLNISTQEKADIMEQFMIYKSEPIGPMRLEFKNKLNQLLKNRNPEITRLRKICPEIEKDIEQTIVNLDTTDHNKIILYQKYQIYNNMSELDERNGMESWFRLTLNLPYNKFKPTPIENKIRHLADELDRRLYGMQKFKNHILVEVNRYLHNPKNTRNIALKGPPGIGKTSVIKIVSEAIGIPFYCINAGGMDVDSLIGCNYAYRGAHEGEITRALNLFHQLHGSNSGFIYFDEYDKIGGTDDDPGSRDSAAVQAELIRITDKTQNSRFKDLFLMGLEQNLENILFFFSMNANPRNTAMLDRLTVIEMDGYTQKEKCTIARRHLVPEAIAELGLNPNDIVFEDKVISNIALKLSDEKGVRSLKNAIQYIVNMIYFRITNPDISEIYKYIPTSLPVVVTEKMFEELNDNLNIDKKHLTYYT